MKTMAPGDVKLLSACADRGDRGYSVPTRSAAAAKRLVVAGMIEDVPPLPSRCWCGKCEKKVGAPVDDVKCVARPTGKPAQRPPAMGLAYLASRGASATSKVTTWSVCSSAYLDIEKGRLTHACEVGDDGFPVRVLCKTVQLDSILDDKDAIDGNTPPTCPVCAKRDPRRAD